VEIFGLPFLRHAAEIPAVWRTFLYGFPGFSARERGKYGCRFMSRMQNDGPLTYPELLLIERKRELERLDARQSDYETCRRSLKQAIQELTKLLLDAGIHGGPVPRCKGSEGR
jgi:hypothetical protein